MTPLQAGAAAPVIPVIDFSAGPTLLFFFKVTCPVCQLAAPRAHELERAYPGRIVGIGQDPRPKLDAFDQRYGLGFRTLSESPPYRASNGYGLRTVPTLFLVDPDGRVSDTVEGWDRDGYNRASRSLADVTGASFVPVSRPGDGLPAFRPG